MKASPDTLVTTHQIATARKRAGKPSWAYRLNVASLFKAHRRDDNPSTFEQFRDDIVNALRMSSWVKSILKNDEFARLGELVEELSDCDDPDDFNYIWSEIYDEADYDRCWIATF